MKDFLKRKNIEISAKRYGIDALGAMAHGLFCSLLIGTIFKTLGSQLGIQMLTDIGTYASAVSGPAMAGAIGYALKADPMVLYSLAAVGWAANAEGGAGGPLAVLVIAIIAAECGKMVSCTIFRTPSKMGKGILVTPTVDGNLLVGPTSVDIEDKEDKSTTAEGFALIMREALENVDGMMFGKSITSFCGLRAVGSTGDFVINMPKARFVNVAGIESPGLSSAPAIGEYVVELLQNAGVRLEPNESYQPTRPAAHAFREASIEEKNAIIRRDPAYGRVICRCETVTEGEILAAIRQNPKPRDLDGVKRRTRAQMGRCQGGFCSPYIVELLAREMQVPYESITKFGGGSLINVSKTKEGN